MKTSRLGKKRPLPALLLACCMAGSSLLPLWAGQVQAAEQETDTLRFVNYRDVRDLNPHLYAGEMYAQEMLYETLVDIGPDGYKPCLAESWEISPDGKVYTFKIRKGVTFTDGTPCDAYAVKANFDAILENRARHTWLEMMHLLEKIEAPDAETFRIYMKAPYWPMLIELGVTRPFAMISPKAMKDGSTKDGVKAFIGTGPYKLTKVVTDEYAVFEANENYWGELPDVEKVIVSVIPDPSTQSMMFQNGELDLLDLDYLDSSVVNSTYKTQYADNLIYGNRLAITYMSMNQNIEPFNDVRVRKAVQMAIDRQALLDAVYSGDGNVEDGIFPRGLVGHNPDLEGTITYDPEGAKALLAEAGYADGFTMQFDADNSASSSVMLLYQIIQQQLAEVGITVKINSMDESSWLDLRSSGDMNSFIGTWTADYNDPDNFIYTFFGNEEKTTLRSLNYPDTEVMQRVADARAIVDTDERLAEYADLEYKIVIEDAAWVPLFSRQHLFAVGDNVESFIPFWAGYGDIIYRDVTLKS